MSRLAFLAVVALLAGCKNTTDPILRDELCLVYKTDTVLVPQYMTVCTNGTCRSQFTYFLPVPVLTCTKKTWIESPNPDYIEPEKAA